MDARSPLPNESTPMQELGDALRPAVEQVRAAPPPPAAVERSLDRAQALGPPPVRRRRSLLWAAAVGCAAAAVLVGVGLWSGHVQKLADGFAWRQGPVDEPQPVAVVHNAPEEGQQPQSEPGDPKDSPRDAKGDTKPHAADPSTVESRTEEKNKSAPEAPTPDQGKAAPGEGRGDKDKDVESSTARSVTPASKPEATAAPPVHFPPRATDPAAPGRRPVPGMAPPPAPPPGPAGSGGTTTGGAVPGGPTGRPEGGGREGGQGQGNGRPGGDRPNRPLDDNQAEGRSTRSPGTGEPGKGAEGRDATTPEKLDEFKGELGRKMKDAERGWKEMPEGERRKALEELKRDLPPRRKEAVDAYFAALSHTPDKGTKPAEKGPAVWHRDRARPTFARVYVGDGNALELVSLHVTVTVEGPRARTVVDHVFRNPHDRQLEGTFEYPLPSGASPAYFAMFLGQTRATAPPRFRGRGGDAPLPADALARLTPQELARQVDTTDWGRLQEARVVSKEKALETYEEVVRGRIDPALLEYAGGNTFSGRVFPIPPKGYNRVLLAYEELLPVAQEKMVYRFSLPGRQLHDLQFTLQARSAECLTPTFAPDGARKEENGGRVTFTRGWKDTKPEGEVVFACKPADPDVQAVSGRQGDNGPRYLYARVRPRLKQIAQDKPFASHAVFMLDTSLSEHPDRFAVSMKLLQKILETDAAIKHFNVLTFNVGAAWLQADGWLDNTAAGREKALARLDGLALEGATDLSCALAKLVRPGFDVPAGTPLNVFLLSDGHITWGEPDAAALVAGFERDCPYPVRFHCYRTGLGQENQELFEALTRKGGGVFQCYGEADVAPAAKAHRSQCLQVQSVRFKGGPEASDVLVAGRKAAVYPGGELVVAARFAAAGRTTLVVEGELAGHKAAEEFPLEVKSTGELAPRGWGEVAVASLLALHEPNLDSLVTAYCQQFGIGSAVASFLVLENDNDYKRLNLEAERGKTVNGDLGEFLAAAWARLGQAAPPRQALDRFLTQVDKRVNLLGGPAGAHVKQLLALLKDGDCELPTGIIKGGLVDKKAVAAYLAQREPDRRNVSPYLAEARRRADDADVDGAVRVLSSIIEEHPSRGDALRLVGYRLLDLGRPEQACRLFAQVQKQRPFEPHSYRDLAHALERSGKYGLAALNYEAVLAGNWHNRFRESLKVVAEEEYARMMQHAIRAKALSPSLANHFGERLEQMARPQPKSDLRVTISWNTDATDVDLWVIEPDGTKCFYSHNRTKNGGELSQDQTQGYGPERYQVEKALPGTYTIIVHYYRPNPNLLGGETHVNVTVTRGAGGSKEQTQRHTVILKKHDEQVEVAKVKF